MPPTRDDEVCDCPPDTNRDELSMAWFRAMNPRPAGALWVPHHYGPGIQETIEPRSEYL